MNTELKILFMIRRVVGLVVLVLALSFVPAEMATAGEDATAVSDCAAVGQQMVEANSRLAADLRQIKREIAALRQEVAEPGVKDVITGIGYIFGLCGVAFFVAARNKAKDSGEGTA